MLFPAATFCRSPSAVLVLRRTVIREMAFKSDPITEHVDVYLSEQI